MKASVEENYFRESFRESFREIFRESFRESFRGNFCESNFSGSFHESFHGSNFRGSNHESFHGRFCGSFHEKVPLELTPRELPRKRPWKLSWIVPRHGSVKASMAASTLPWKLPLLTGSFHSFHESFHGSDESFRGSRGSFHGSDDSFHGSFHELPLEMQIMQVAPRTADRPVLGDRCWTI